MQIVHVKFVHAKAAHAVVTNCNRCTTDVVFKNSTSMKQGC
ncbi:hypothetical protein [Segetibacter aerophilus]|nr:hypothetical protein [Segetibacter aerophilus]